MPYKILLVDDEPIVHIAFRSFVCWEDHACEIVGTAENGRQGLELYQKFHPDIVITDMKMPVMNGLDLIREIKAADGNCVILVLSGYDDFDLVKQAFRLGAIDYIRKMDMTPQSMVEAVESALQILRSRKGEQKGSAQVQHLYYPLDMWDWKKRMPEVVTDTVVFRIALENYNHIEKIYENRMEFFRRSVVEVISSHLSHYGEANISFDQNNIITAILSVFPQETEAVRKVADKAFSGAADTLFRILNVKVWAGGCCTEAQGSKIEELFDSADLALRGAYLFPEERIVFFAKHQNRAPNALRSEQRLQILREFLQAPEKALAEEVYTQLAVTRKEVTAESVSQVRILYAEYDKILAQYEAVDQKVENMGDKTDKQPSLQELNTRLLQRLQTVSHLAIPHDSLRQVLRYIQAHYDAPLTLADVAEKVHLNPAYLSRLFSEKMGKHFTRCLNEYRIEQAKKLMQSGDCKIYEIAAKVGYPNVEYFYRIFKEIEGVSPKKYINERKL